MIVWGYYCVLVILLCFCEANGLRIHGLGFKFARTQPLRMQQVSDEIPKSLHASSFSGAGSLLIVHKGDYDHFLMKQAVFVFCHNDEVTQGVIVSKPTAFCMGEVTPNIGPFKANTMFTGGSDGTDLAIMLHTHKIPGAKYSGSGIYVGGVNAAQKLVEDGYASPNDFKFFFNHVEWAPGVVQNEIAQGRWTAMKAPPEMIIGPSSSQLWEIASNMIASDKQAKT